jgi:hypothetical protein
VTRVRRFAPWLAWWSVLFGVWLLLLSARTVAEAAVGACAAALGVVGVEAVRTGRPARFRPQVGWLRLLPALPYRVVVDSAAVFAELGRHLLLRRPLRGRVRTLRFEAGAERDASSTARRAFALWLASFAPNTFALGIDGERNVIVLHELRARRDHPVPPKLAPRAR